MRYFEKKSLKNLAVSKIVRIFAVLQVQRATL